MMPPFHGSITVAGLLVGLVVGLTGVGGGALMTPVLVLLFGVAPHLAVGTDLLNASISKGFGTAMHAGERTVDWQVVRRLALGSLPAAALTLAWMSLTRSARLQDGFVMAAVGWALLLTAAGLLIVARRRVKAQVSFQGRKCPQAQGEIALNNRQNPQRINPVISRL